jgi:hypothetical protein
MVLEPGEVFGTPRFSPREIGAEVERETIEEPFDELFAAIPAAAPAPAVPRKPPASATLGELYLAQGHLEEAERAFREVLAERPEETAAVRGLEEIARRRSLVAAAADEETVAGWTLAEPAMPAAAEPPARGARPLLGRRSQRKVDVLRDYLRRIGRGEVRRVP